MNDNEPLHLKEDFLNKHILEYIYVCSNLNAASFLSYCI